MRRKRKPAQRSQSRVNAKSNHQAPEKEQLGKDPPKPQPEKLRVELFQRLLNIFNDALGAHSGNNISEEIQQIKQHLYNRDFDSAFGSEELLEAYAIRWSPSRALAYVNILCSSPVLSECFSLPRHGGLNPEGASDGLSGQAPEDEKRLGSVSRVVCIGAGGGAEIVALGGFLGYLEDMPVNQQRRSEDGLASADGSSPAHVEITAIDCAGWGSITSRLHTGITTAPSLSQYASAQIKAANSPLVDSSTCKVRFVQQDILNMDLADLATNFTNADVVTLMFALNELYSTSISATTNLLLSLTMLLSPGALLLVVDSPGSYSTVKLGKSAASHDEIESKKYPMQWLLDHTLLESAAVGSSINASAGDKQWEKLGSCDSEWFRLPEGLVYPIELEDMRYQVHLYRRT